MNRVNLELLDKQSELLDERQEYLKQYGLDEDVDTVAYDSPDEGVAMEFFRREALVSIPWDKLTPEQCELVKDVCYEHMGLDQIARKNKKTLRAVQMQFNELCELLIQLCREETENNEGHISSNPNE